MTPEQKQRLEQIVELRSQNTGPEFGYTHQLCEAIDLLLSLVKEQEAPYGYWPILTDRGDGVKGHYCIGRLIKPGEQYWEYWNKGEWGSAGEVFIGYEAARAQLEAVRKSIGYADPLDNDAVDNEIRRWQDSIRDKLIDLGAPDWKIDGAGCDSGDPLDFTLAEIGQGCGWFIDKADDAATAMRSACVEVAEKFRSRIQYESDEAVRESLFGDMVIEMETVREDKSRG